MPKLVHRPPAYRPHRASGQAVVTFNGVDVYLGDFDTEASRRAYEQRIAQWYAAGRRAPVLAQLPGASSHVRMQARMRAKATVDPFAPRPYTREAYARAVARASVLAGSLTGTRIN